MYVVFIYYIFEGHTAQLVLHHLFLYSVFNGGKCGGDLLAYAWGAVPSWCQYSLAARHMHASSVRSMRFVCLG